MKITDSIKYIGVDDKTIDLFESQYKVPNGISYNSYLIMDDKITIMDTVDKRASEKWMKNLENALAGKVPEYLVISHLEPDHSANIKAVADKYPNMKLVGNEMTFKMLPQFFKIDNLENRKVVVKENDTLNIGKHTLQFVMAPMVHWPEVMCTYDLLDKVLFTADGFGKFGALDTDEDWDCEARRYYFNIVGKYGMQVQNLLKKVANLDVKIICPLHGPTLKDNLPYYINKYDVWSSYKPEDNGIFIACSSIHGNTYKACEILKKMLEEKGATNVVLADLTRCDKAEALEDAFRYSKMILASSTYNMGIFTPMLNFLNELKGKNFQNRVVGIVENGSWAPSAGKEIYDIVSNFKDIKIVEPIVTIKTTLNEESKNKLEALANAIIQTNNVIQ